MFSSRCTFSLYCAVTSIFFSIVAFIEWEDHTPWSLSLLAFLIFSTLVLVLVKSSFSKHDELETKYHQKEQEDRKSLITSPAYIISSGTVCIFDDVIEKAKEKKDRYLYVSGSGLELAFSDAKKFSLKIEEVLQAEVLCRWVQPFGSISGLKASLYLADKYKNLDLCFIDGSYPNAIQTFCTKESMLITFEDNTALMIKDKKIINSSAKTFTEDVLRNVVRLNPQELCRKIILLEMERYFMMAGRMLTASLPGLATPSRSLQWEFPSPSILLQGKSYVEVSTKLDMPFTDHHIYSFVYPKAAKVFRHYRRKKSLNAQRDFSKFSEACEVQYKNFVSDMNVIFPGTTIENLSVKRIFKKSDSLVNYYLNELSKSLQPNKLHTL